VQAKAWKQQAIIDCGNWAEIRVKDSSQLLAFKAGVASGWDECLNTLKLHNMIKEGN